MNSAPDLFVDELTDKLNQQTLPPDLKIKLESMLSGLSLSANSDNFWQIQQNVKKYFDWVLSIPWTQTSQDILDLDHVSSVLNQSHYGLDSIKERLLEYISVLSIQKTRHPQDFFSAPVLLFVGLVGTGKTTISRSIATALGRQFIRIPLGGLGDANYLRGQSRTLPQAEPGQIIKALIKAKTKNPIILLDEIDRIDDSALNTVMGVLVELLDPEQNHRFTDYFIDYPVDLSQVFFCATCNNTNRIATAVLDRLEIIEMPSYGDDDKIKIAQNYLLPQAIKAAGLEPNEIIIDPDLWPQIVRPLGFDAGVRTLKRNIESLTRKAVRIILDQSVKQVVVNSDNLKQFIPQW